MLCGALKQADRLGGTVVILVVVWGIGVQVAGLSVVVRVTVVRCIRLAGGHGDPGRAAWADSRRDGAPGAVLTQREKKQNKR